ncbi:MAG: Hsp20 family protein [Alphaproteobacteria bacterium]|tara:strand:+ start:1587 stop:2012 length:426 start_codon:yes stop_codon:yes gene_type:complete
MQNLTTFDTNKFLPYSVGFDNLFDKLFDMDLDSSNSYPPYNISKVDENNYIIEMALAGFNKADLEIELTSGELTIKSKKKDDLDKNHNLIHQGISQRSFVRKFTLSDEILVKNAEMKDGMLIISLERLIPEHKKPKSISIR